MNPLQTQSFLFKVKSFASDLTLFTSGVTYSEAGWGCVSLSLSVSRLYPQPRSLSSLKKLSVTRWHEAAGWQLVADRLTATEQSREALSAAPHWGKRLIHYCRNNVASVTTCRGSMADKSFRRLHTLYTADTVAKSDRLVPVSAGDTYELWMLMYCTPNPIYSV